MYSATLRLISNSKAEAEMDESLMVQGVFTPGMKGDGTVQVEVENLNPEHISVGPVEVNNWVNKFYESKDRNGEDAMPGGLSSFIAERVNEVVNLAFRQGAMSEVKARVTYKFKQ